jgi:hypothetical protein
MEQTEQTVQTDTALQVFPDDVIELAIISEDKPKVIRFTQTGVDIPEDLTFQEWYTVLQSVKWHHKKLAIAFADVIQYGNKHFGNDKVSESLEQLEFELPFVKSALAINSVPPEFRHPGLSAEHYVAIAKSDLSKKEKQKWAELADKLKLTATQLRLSMAQGEVIDTAATRAMNTGIITIPGIRQEFDVWLHRVGGFEGVQKMDINTKEDIYEELVPVVEFALKLSDDLEGVATANE